LKGHLRICFVCLGNIIRSPLAENLFLNLAEDAGYGDLFEVDSAGTSGYHIGEAPDRRMRRVAASHGVVYQGSARQFTRDDFDRFDLIIAMDNENVRDLRVMAATEEQTRKIHLLRAFDPMGGAQDAVPDPYYGGIDGFEETYRIVERSCKGLLDALMTSGSAG